LHGNSVVKAARWSKKHSSVTNFTEARPELGRRDLPPRNELAKIFRWYLQFQLL